MRVQIALIQTDAGAESRVNVARAAALADEAAAGGAQLIALPEYLQFRGGDEGFRASARPIPGEFTDTFAAVAKRRGCWILAGSLAETSDDPERPWNTSSLISPDGEVVARYRKIHLFDVEVRDGPVDRESARVSGGTEPVVAEAAGLRIGMTICYDLRFPELYRTLALAGAEVLAVPSNFMERTGRDHWEVLLRARAIENACWVIAPSQTGGPPGVPAFGRSMVIDPWGTVVAQAPDRECIVRAEIDSDRVTDVRHQIPVLANRRPAAYRLAPEGDA